MPRVLWENRWLSVFEGAENKESERWRRDDKVWKDELGWGAYERAVMGRIWEIWRLSEVSCGGWIKAEGLGGRSATRWGTKMKRVPGREAGRWVSHKAKDKVQSVSLTTDSSSYFLALKPHRPVINISRINVDLFIQMPNGVKLK